MSVLGLTFELDKDSRLPVRHQVSALFKQSILGGRLMAGQLLPSTRELSVVLGISRSTCVRVYEDLSSQGFIETSGGTGTFVRFRPAAVRTRAETGPAPSLSGYSRQLLLTQPQKLMAHDFPELNHGCAPAEFLPVKLWRQALLACAQQFDQEGLDYGTDPFGYRPLREAICAYLYRSRMIDCPVDRLVIFSSSAYPVKLAAEMLIDPGDNIVFPEPGAPYARNIFTSLGAHLIGLETDENGMKVDQLQRSCEAAKLVYVNSLHHGAHGAVLSQERRKALLEWASKRAVMIVEDDCNAGFNYNAANLPSLRALSETDNVLYISNFWQTLYPLVNVSFMIAPAQLVPVLRRAWEVAHHSFHTHLPLFDQQALAMLLNEGDYEKHLRRVQPVFASRWRTLVHELTKQFGKEVEITRGSSAYQVSVTFKSAYSEAAVIESAKSAELPLVLGRNIFAGAAKNGEFIIPFAQLTEEQIEQKVGAFGQHLKSSSACTQMTYMANQIYSFGVTP